MEINPKLVKGLLLSRKVEDYWHRSSVSVADISYLSPKSDVYRFFSISPP